MGLADYIAYETSVGLSVAWGLDETTGITAAEKSGAYAGTYQPGSGSPAAWTGGTLNVQGPFAGSTGKAASFNGTSGYVLLPASSSIVGAATKATTCAWAKPSSMGSDQRIFTLPIDGNSRFAILLGRVSGRVSAFFRDAAGAIVQLDSSATYPAGQWLFVAATVSGSTGTLYVNGQQAGQSTGVDAAQTLACNSRGARIGTDPNSLNGWFSGGLARVAFGPVALTPAQVATLYAKALAAGLPHVYAALLQQQLNPGGI